MVDLTGQGIQKYPVDYENSGLSWPLLYNASWKAKSGFTYVLSEILIELAKSLLCWVSLGSAEKRFRMVHWGGWGYLGVTGLQEYSNLCIYSSHHSGDGSHPLESGTSVYFSGAVRCLSGTLSISCLTVAVHRPATRTGTSLPQPRNNLSISNLKTINSLRDPPAASSRGPPWRSSKGLRACSAKWPFWMDPSTAVTWM